jgi:hypothetical protein
MFFPSFPNNALLPVASYTRSVNVDSSEFDSIFTGVKRFDDVRTYLIISGILLSIVFIVISILLYIKLGNVKKNKPDQLMDSKESEGSKKRNLIR